MHARCGWRRGALIALTRQGHSDPNVGRQPEIGPNNTPSFRPPGNLPPPLLHPHPHILIPSRRHRYVRYRRALHKRHLTGTPSLARIHPVPVTTPSPASVNTHAPTHAMSHPTESRLPRSNSSASLRSINNVVTSPEVATTKIAQRTSVLGPQRKTALPVGTTKLARAAQSKRKSFTGASTGVVGPTAPEVTTAAAPPTQTQTCVNPSASAASVSQIPRSAIPRPPTMTNLVAAAAAASTTAATTATKPASQPSTISTGVNAATLAALTGTAAGGASTRVLRNRTLSRPASIAVMPSTSGLPRSASQHNLGLKAPDKASIPLKLEKDKQKHKHKVADKEKDKPLVGAKRVPLPGPTPAVKDDVSVQMLHLSWLI